MEKIFDLSNIGGIAMAFYQVTRKNDHVGFRGIEDIGLHDIDLGNPDRGVQQRFYNRNNGIDEKALSTGGYSWRMMSVESLKESIPQINVSLFQYPLCQILFNTYYEEPTVFDRADPPYTIAAFLPLSKEEFREILSTGKASRWSLLDEITNENMVHFVGVGKNGDAKLALADITISGKGITTERRAAITGYKKIFVNEAKYHITLPCTMFPGQKIFNGQRRTFETIEIHNGSLKLVPTVEHGFIEPTKPTKGFWARARAIGRELI